MAVSQGSLISVAKMQLSAQDIADGIAKTKAAAAAPPPLPEGLDDHISWQQIIIVNATPWDLSYVDGYESKGIFYTSPHPVRAFSICSFGVSNSSDEVGKNQGVEGGTAWRLTMDEDNDLAVSIGWRVSRELVYKDGIVISPSAKEGADAATEGITDFLGPDEYITETTEIHHGQRPKKPYEFKIRLSDEKPNELAFITIEITPPPVPTN